MSFILKVVPPTSPVCIDWYRNCLPFAAMPPTKDVFNATKGRGIVTFVKHVNANKFHLFIVFGAHDGYISNITFFFFFTYRCKSAGCIVILACVINFFGEV